MVAFSAMGRWRHLTRRLIVSPHVEVTGGIHMPVRVVEAVGTYLT